MAESDLNYIKTILRSVLTSCPTNMTIKQMLADYVNLEGSHIPYKELGFKTIFELLETVKDVLQIPNHPNINSPVKLVVDEKSSHLRDLVVNQKNQKTRKKEFPNKSHHFKNTYNTNIKKRSTINCNVPNYISNVNNACNNNASACRYTNDTPVSDYNTSKYNNSTYDVSHNKPRGYNFVKKKSYNSQKGVVTKELKKYIENLCNSSQNISILALKSHLINHPDYKKLNTMNIEEATRMLKFFIYINKGLVYLKDSPNEIFSNNNSYLKDKNLTHINYTQNIVDENEEILYSINNMEDIGDYDLMDYSVTNNDNTNTSYMNNSYSFEVQEKTDSSNDKEIKCDTLEVQQKNNKEIKCDTLEVQQKNDKEIKSDTLEIQQKNDKKIKCDTLEVQQKNDKEIKCDTLEVQQKNDKEIKCDTFEVQQKNYKEIKSDTLEVQQKNDKKIKSNTLEIQQKNDKEIKSDTLEVQQKNDKEINSDTLEVQQKNDKEIKCDTLEVQQKNYKEIKSDTLEVQQKNDKEIKFDTIEIQQKNDKEIKCDTLEVQQKNDKEIKCDTLEVQQKNDKEISNDTLEVQQKNDKEIKCETLEVQQKNNKEINSDTLEVQQKNDEEIKCDTLKVQLKNDNLLNISEVLNVEPLHNNIKLETKSQNNRNKTWILKSSEKDGIDYISLIISIIENSTIPITVKNVMDNFQIQHGYSFPHKKFSCRTCMDFFRLYPSCFILDDHYSTNSIVRVNKNDVPKQHFKLRERIVEASIFKNDIHDSLEGINVLPDYMSKLNLANNNSQGHNNEKQSKKLICSYEAFDSNKILDSMKIKMRSVLNKYKNGILCDEFMDVYAKEYQSHFMFTDYGFKSMRDMAYKLPSVFYVKMVEERDECILYSTCRRVELESDVNDPSLFYKNIPRTVLNNLSIFFNNYRTGIMLDELMQLYCAEFGRSYEPLKYGYLSEKHMFESLPKMVRIQNNVLYTVDPFAYRYFVENNECVVNNTTPALPINNFLLNYTGNDVCNGKFQYTEVRLPNQNIISVVAAEIYNMGLFYLNLFSNMDMLNNLMGDLQCFYELNENKYQVNPELLIPGLACTSRFENSMKWHRAKILKIVDELNVQVIYVDYGSVETIPKTSVRLLERKFGFMHTQGIACSLFEDNAFNRTYPVQINRMFASLIDGNILTARFNQLTSKNPNKRIVKLYLKSDKESVNINKKCSLAMKYSVNQISIRRRITKMYD